MLFIILFSILFLQGQTGSSSLEQQVQKQAEFYIQNLQENNQPDIHQWALITLCENENVRSIINSNDINVPMGSCGREPLVEKLTQAALNMGSQNLLLAAILQQETTSQQQELYHRFRNKYHVSRQNGINYDEIINRVIERDSIDHSSLPVDQFYFPHFLLLFDNEMISSNVLTDHYVEELTGAWSDQNTEPDETLLSSLKLFSYLRGLYLNYEYVDIFPLFSKITGEALFPISKFRLRVYRHLDYSMYKAGNYARSLDALRQYSKPLAGFLDSKEELSVLFYQAGYLYELGKIKDAKRIYEQILAKDFSTLSQSSFFTNLGVAYLKSGNFDEYLELQFKALKLAETEDNYQHQYKILRNLHIYYRRNGNIDSSLRYINEALKLSKDHGNLEDLGLVYTSLGVFYRDLKSNPDSASYYFEKAKSVLNKDQNFNRYVVLLREKARLYESNNEYKKALDIYRDIKALVKSKEQSPTYIDALIDEARILLHLGKLVEVENILAELKNSDLFLLDFSEIIKEKTLRAGYLIKTGQDQDAYELMKPAIKQVVERAKSSTDLQSGFWSVEQEYINGFKLWVELLIDTNRPGEAVLALDQLKTINDAAFYQDPMVKSSQLNESELSQYRNLTRELDKLRKQQLSSSSDNQVQLQSKIDRLNAQKRALDRKITQYADRPTVSIDQIQQRLTSKDLIIHITELKNTYYFAQISRRNVKFQKVELDKSTRSLFEQAIQELSQGETDLNKLYQISEILELSNIPDVTENVIMIPDSYLFQLPIDILPADAPSHNYSYGGTTYQIEQFRTEYLTSLNELVYGAETEKSFNWDYVGFGITDFSNDRSNLMPLPHAGKEVTQISRELTNLESHRTILEENSTEDAFRQNAPKARVLHLATHSRVSEQDPLFSTIYMSETENQKDSDQFNGQIFAYELFEMNLSNELIMLNSCESGTGSYLQGSGIVGISRALRYAGAESLVLNLWSVNDMMASDFAVEFYKAINKGDSKSEALRKAKIHFLKQKNANPHYWGPYMLIGSSRPIVKPQQSTNLLFAGGFLLYLVVMVGLSYTVQLKKDSSDLEEAA